MQHHRCKGRLAPLGEHCMSLIHLNASSKQRPSIGPRHPPPATTLGAHRLTSTSQELLLGLSRRRLFYHIPLQMERSAAPPRPVILTIPHADVGGSTRDMVYRLCPCRDCSIFRMSHHGSQGEMRDATGQDRSLHPYMPGSWRRRQVVLGRISDWSFETPPAEPLLCQPSLEAE